MPSPQETGGSSMLACQQRAMGSIRVRSQNGKETLSFRAVEVECV